LEGGGVTEERICKGCGETKPVELFYRNRGGRAGYEGKCKVCIEKRRRDRAGKGGAAGIRMRNVEKYRAAIAVASSLEDVAGAVGVSASRVRGVMRELGIPVPPSWSRLSKLSPLRGLKDTVEAANGGWTALLRVGSPPWERCTPEEGAEMLASLSALGKTIGDMRSGIKGRLRKLKEDDEERKNQNHK